MDNQKPGCSKNLYGNPSVGQSLLNRRLGARAAATSQSSQSVSGVSLLTYAASTIEQEMARGNVVQNGNNDCSYNLPAPPVTSANGTNLPIGNGHSASGINEPATFRFVTCANTGNAGGFPAYYGSSMPIAAAGSSGDVPSVGGIHVQNEPLQVGQGAGALCVQPSYTGASLYTPSYMGVPAQNGHVQGLPAFENTFNRHAAAINRPDMVNSTYSCDYAYVGMPIMNGMPAYGTTPNYIPMGNIHQAGYNHYHDPQYGHAQCGGEAAAGANQHVLPNITVSVPTAPPQEYECLGQEMFVLLQECMFQVTEEMKTPDNGTVEKLRTCLVDFDKIRANLRKDQAEFIQDLLDNGHSNHWSSFCGYPEAKKCPLQEADEGNGASEQNPLDYTVNPQQPAATESGLGQPGGNDAPIGYQGEMQQ